ncbi:hypothetical protein Tco_1051029 [Tanacetum coccineum]
MFARGEEYKGQGFKDYLVKDYEDEEDEDKDEIKGLIWVNNHIANKRGKNRQIIKEILVNFAPTSNVERNVEKEDSSSITAKIHDVERQILEASNDSIGNCVGHVSYTKLLNCEEGRKSVNFCTLLAPTSNGADVSISLDSWPMVKRIVSLMLKKWSSDANLMKEVVCNVPVWVKFHDVLIIVFTKDGLSVIATKLGTPLMLDSYTSVMCTELWNMKTPRQAVRGVEVTNAKNNTIFPTTSNSFDASNNLADVDDGGGSKTLSAQEAIQIEVHGRKDKHANVPSSSSCEQPPIIEKEVSLKSADMPSTNVVDVDN